MTTIKTGTSLIATAAIMSACAFLVLSDQPAFADDQASHLSDDFAFDFAYAPQELQSVDQADKLFGRLQHQVRRQCRSETRLTLAARTLTDACVDATLAATVSKIGSSTLATAYRNRTEG